MQTKRFALTAVLLVIVLSCLTGCLTGCGAGRGSVDQGTVATRAPGVADIDVVALGDSVVSGTTCDCRTFVQRYAGLVAGRTGAQVNWTNDGVNGQTSSSLLTDLSSRGTSADVRKADVVLITIGANDLAPALRSWQDDGCPTSCMTADLPAMSRNIAEIVARVRRLRGDRPVLIAVTDYWNVFEDGQVADRDYGNGFAAWSDRTTRLANHAICTAAAQATTCVDLYAAFNGDGDHDPTALLADDGDHPDAAGHAVIARTLAASVMPTATPTTQPPGGS